MTETEFLTSWREISGIAADWASIGGFLLALIVTIAGALFYWPRFMRQKRLENANENAWRVLELLDDAEEPINSLFWAYKNRKDNSEQFTLQKNAILSLRRLLTGLFVLQKTTSQMQGHIDWLAAAIKAHQVRTRSIRNGNKAAHSGSTDLLDDLGIGSFSAEEPNFTKFEELRQLVASVAGLYHQNLSSIRKIARKIKKLIS